MSCWRCGNEMKQDDPYCKECGERANIKVNKKTFFGKYTVVIIAILVGSLLIGMLMIIIETQIEKSRAATEASITEVSESIEDYQAKCKTYSYEELASNPKQYENQYMTFTGQVVDAVPNGRQVILRIKVTPRESTTWDNLWEDDIYVVYTGENEVRLLKDDLITLWGVCRGEKTYKTVTGSSDTIPYIEAKIIENKGKAEPKTKGLDEEQFSEDESFLEGELKEQTDISLEDDVEAEGTMGSAFIRNSTLTLNAENIEALFALDESLVKAHFGESREEYIFGGVGRLFSRVPLWTSFGEEGIFAVVAFNGSHIYGLDFTENAEEVLQKLGPSAYSYNSEESGELSIEYSEDGYRLSIMFNENNDIYVMLIKKIGV